MAMTVCSKKENVEAILRVEFVCVRNATFLEKISPTSFYSTVDIRAVIYREKLGN